MTRKITIVPIGTNEDSDHHGDKTDAPQNSPRGDHRYGDQYDVKRQ